MRIAILISLTLALFACDSREDYFEAINNGPVIKIFYASVELDSSFITDSIKVGFSKDYEVTLSDEENLSLSYDISEGLTMDGETFKTVNASEEGLKVIRFYAKDSFNRLSEKSLNLTCFSNLLPVAKFTVNVLANRDIEVVATGSYDRDARFGGFIDKYEYSFNGNIQTSSLSTVRYHFGSAGSKRIELRVKDNNGAWSDKIETYVTIN